MAILTYENIIDPILRNIRQAVVDFSGMKPGDKVLDVCCGTGAQVIEYGKLGITACGIDSAENMLGFGVKNSVKLNLNDTSFLLADATALPFDDGSFDYVSISFAIHDKNRDMRGQIISEMKRVLKPQGSLIFIDFRVPMPRNPAGAAARVIEFFAGGDHYKGFKDYSVNGGLQTLLEKHSLKTEKTGYFLSGIAIMVKARIDSAT